MKFKIVLIIAACAMECWAITKIACIGNSITFGYGLSDAALQSYPGRLQALLGKTDYTVQNDGVNSTTLTKKGDNPYWKNGMLPQVFSFQPDIITIKLGTNDTKPQNWEALGYGAQFKTDYFALIDTLRAMASHPKIYLILPIPVIDAKVPGWGIRDSVIKKEMVIIKDVAAARSLTVIDANTPLKNFPQYLAVDGVHPNAAGEDTIAHVVYRALKTTSVKEITVSRLSPLPKMRDGSVVEVFSVEGKRLDVRIVSGPARVCGIPKQFGPGLYIVRVVDGNIRYAAFKEKVWLSRKT